MLKNKIKKTIKKIDRNLSFLTVLLFYLSGVAGFNGWVYIGENGNRKTS